MRVPATALCGRRGWPAKPSADCPACTSPTTRRAQDRGRSACTGCGGLCGRVDACREYGACARDPRTTLWAVRRWNARPAWSWMSLAAPQGSAVPFLMQSPQHAGTSFPFGARFPLCRPLSVSRHRPDGVAFCLEHHAVEVAPHDHRRPHETSESPFALRPTPIRRPRVHTGHDRGTEHAGHPPHRTTRCHAPTRTT